MTEQLPDVVEHKGEDCALCSYPLDPLLKRRRRTLTFCWSTCCHRRYVAKWRIADGKLFLTQIGGLSLALPGMFTSQFVTESDSPTVAIWRELLFPNTEGPIFARWFTGTLVIPDAETFRYRNTGYATLFQRHSLLEVVEGGIVAERVEDGPVEAFGGHR